MSKISLSPSPTGSAVYTIASPAGSTDRTLTLPDNSGTVVSTGSTAAVSQPMLATLVVPVGVGQTWQDVTASRSLNTIYTNTTGRPIVVSVNTNLNSSTVNLNVGSVTLSAQGNTAAGPGNIYGIVPNNTTYQVTGVAPYAWLELR